jgi:phage gpG-like protein
MSNQSKIDAYFAEFQNRILKAKAELLPILANDTVNYALENFAKESFEKKAWEPRKDKTNKRSLLVKSGRLKRSIRVVAIRSSGYSVGSDVPYASVHNYGQQINKSARSETFVRNRSISGKRKGKFAKGTIAGQGFTFKPSSYNMPQRQFLGASQTLKTRLETIAKREIIKAINA